MLIMNCELETLRLWALVSGHIHYALYTVTGSLILTMVRVEGGNCNERS